MILNNIIAIKSEDLDDDLPSWKWLQHLIKTLGEDGMSSEESSVECYECPSSEEYGLAEEYQEGARNYRPSAGY